tara:strand:+ start:138 stop:647 length:510 start_codon:yes stop_codon:yes gene_type:complete
MILKVIESFFSRLRRHKYCNYENKEPVFIGIEKDRARYGKFLSLVKDGMDEHGEVNFYTEGDRATFELIGKGKVRFHLVLDFSGFGDPRVIIYGLGAKPAGTGLGTEILKILCREDDSMGLGIGLNSVPSSAGEVSYPNLRESRDAWLSRHGFEYLPLGDLNYVRRGKD